MARAQFSFDAVTLDTQGHALPTAPVYEAQARTYRTGDTPPAWPASLPTQTSREFTIPYDIVGGYSLDCRVRVTAQGYAAASAWSQVITGMPCSIVMNAVGVRASSGEASVTLDWDDGGPGQAQVQLQQVGGAWGQQATPTETIYTWGSLTQGRAYRARVRYVYTCAGATLTSDWVTSQEVRTCPEVGTPTISGHSATATTITVNWTGGGPGTPRAEIREVAPNVGQWVAATGVTGTSHTFTGLVTGCTHQVRVRYGNTCAGQTDLGTWALSGEIIAADPPPCPQAGRVQSLGRMGETDTTLTVQAIHDLPVTEFQFRLDGVEHPWQRYDSIRFTGLTPGTVYMVAARARNSPGGCTASVSIWEEQDFSTDPASTVQCPAPGAPTNLGATNVTEDSFTATWRNGSNFVAGATSTLIQLDGKLLRGDAAGSTSKVIAHLQRNTEYRFRIAHQRYQVNAGGGTCSTTLGEWSPEFTVRTGGAPCTSPNIPAAYLPSAAGQRSVEVGELGGGTYTHWRFRVTNESGSTVLQTSDWIVKGATESATGLTCNTAYQVQVQALNRCGGGRVETAGGWSPHLAIRTARCTDTCLAPRVPGLSFTATTRTSLALSASVPDNAEEFRFRVGSTTTRWQTDNDVTVDGLTCNTTYQCAVQARDRCPGGLVAESDWSGNLAVRTSDCNLQPCTTPTWGPGFATAASQETQTSVVLSWAPAEDATDYIARVGGSEFYTTTNSVTATGLTCGTNYTWEVLAINELLGCETARTTYRQGLAFRTAACPPPPCPAPAAPTITPGTSTLDSVSGTISSLANADLYQVRFKRAESGSPVALEEDPQASRQFTIPNLDCGQTYEVEARGINNCSGSSQQANGEWGHLVRLTTLACQPPCTTPAWPQGINPSASATQTSVTVTWAAGNNASYYFCRYRLTSTNVWITSGRLTTTTFAWVANCNEQFTWEVRAFSTGSCLTTFTTWRSGGIVSTEGCEAVPCPVPAWPSNLAVSVTGISRTGFALTHAAATPATHYRLVARGPNTVVTPWVASTSHQVTGLDCGATYQVYALARNDCGTGPVGDAAEQLLRQVTLGACADCTAPQFLSGVGGGAEAITETTARVTFNNATFPRNTTRQEYRIHHEGGTTAWESASGSVDLVGLDCGTTYIWQVQARAVCTTDDGREVHAVSSVEAGGTFRTAACANTLCTTPTFTRPLGGAVESRTTTSLTVVWQPVTGATRYNLRATGGGSTVTTTTTSPRANLGGLVCGTGYTVDLDALAEGDDCTTTSTGWRQLLAAATTAACPRCTPPELVNNSVDYSAITQVSATLTWRPWENATGYQAELRATTGAVITTPWTANNSYSFTGLTCNTAYQLYLRARNVCRPGNPSLTTTTPYEQVGVLFRTLHCGAPPGG